MYRKGVTALILNQENKILLINLMSFKNHFFALPGGGIESGEKVEEALLREIQEELGIQSQYFNIEKRAQKPMRFEVSAGSFVRDGVTYIGQERLFFLVRFIAGDDKIRLNKEEVRRYVWASFEDLKRFLLFDNQLEETVSQIQQLCPEIIAWSLKTGFP